MDKEYTKKITECIKKRLKEIQGGVITGLPDYILIMIANKKTESQMAQDLKVFLGSSSAQFAKWLVDLLNDMKYPKEDKGKSELSNKEQVDDDVLKLTDQELESDDLIPKEDSELVAVEKVITQPEIPNDESVIKEPPNVDIKPEQTKNVQVNSHHKQEVKEVPTTKPKSKVIVSSKPKQVEQESSDEYEPAYVCKPKSRGKRVEERESSGEYDPLYPSYVSSKIQTIPRKSSIPINMQANKLLLLKAIDAANNSVNGKENLDQVYKPTPIKVLVAGNRNTSFSDSPNSQSDSHDSVKNWELQDDLDFEDDHTFWCEKSTAKSNYKNLIFPQILNTNDDDVVSGEPLSHREVIMSSPKKTNTLFIESCDSSSELQDVTLHEYDQYIPRAPSPHFVVTLDGVPETLKLKRSFSDTINEKPCKNYVPIDTSDLSAEKDTESEEVTMKKQKLIERCKFWPSCKNSDNCDYHHPNVPCKLFPNCKFGDTCLYIHPNCKFDSRCTRKDCPYTHASKRDFLVPPKVHSNFMRKKSVAPVSPPLCKFYPNCTAYPCPFFHQKKCRFGNECNTPNCQFSHQNFPARNQLKWKACSSS